MITGGHNIGRVGTITTLEKHPGSFHIVHVKDSAGHSFATRYDSNFHCGLFRNEKYYRIEICIEVKILSNIEKFWFSNNKITWPLPMFGFTNQDKSVSVRIYMVVAVDRGAKVAFSS